MAVSFLIAGEFSETEVYCLLTRRINFIHAPREICELSAQRWRNRLLLLVAVGW